MQGLDVVVLVFVELARRNFVAAGRPPLRVEVVAQLDIQEIPRGSEISQASPHRAGISHLAFHTGSA